MGEQDFLQCPCGRIIRSPSEYKLVFVKKEHCEIDILCPNPACHLKELGYIEFRVDKKHGKVLVKTAAFYPPYVTWNATRLGREKAVRMLEHHLSEIIRRQVDWKRISGEAPEACETELVVREEGAE